MAYRAFVTGEVLTAANIMANLMNQAVIVCTAATRPAVTTPCIIFQTDTATFLRWDGTTASPLPGALAPYVRQMGTGSGILLGASGSGSTGTITTITPPVSGRLFWSNTFNARQTAAGTLIGHAEITLGGALGTQQTPDFTFSSSGVTTCTTQGYHDIVGGTAYAVVARAATGAGAGTYSFENHSITIGYGTLLP